MELLISKIEFVISKTDFVISLNRYDFVISKSLFYDITILQQKPFFMGVIISSIENTSYFMMSQNLCFDIKKSS